MRLPNSSFSFPLQQQFCAQEHRPEFTSDEYPQQIQSHTQPAGILETIRKANKITNINLQNSDGNKRTTNQKTKYRKKVMYFSLETASYKDRKLSLSGG
ncbi:hypothetical protein FHG87_008879 [Trinorchestia longiramus]|nr:hypothetical protein FHG87_008879 [Trinorchestia longiramus]